MSASANPAASTREAGLETKFGQCGHGSPRRLGIEINDDVEVNGHARVAM